VKVIIVIFYRIDSNLQFGRVDVVGLGIDIHENRGGAEEADDLSRGNERKRRGEDRIARADSIGHEGHEEGVRSRGAANSVLCSDIGPQFRFQFLDFRAHDVMAMMQNAENSIVERWPDTVLLTR
jgi:hypothetical protein